MVLVDPNHKISQFSLFFPVSPDEILRLWKTKCPVTTLLLDCFSDFQFVDAARVKVSAQCILCDDGSKAKMFSIGNNSNLKSHVARVSGEYTIERFWFNSKHFA